LLTEISFDQEVNDGNKVYPAGLRNLEYKVYVN